MNTRIIQFLIGFVGVLFSTVCSAQNATDIASVIGNIQKAVLVPLLNVTVAIAYLAGAGFVVAAIFKFKAHKDNPTQVTVGTPIMMLFIGIGLLLFPSIVSVVTHSIGFSSGGGSLTFSGGSL